MNAIKHLAIIMDGNQRWSVKNNKTKLDGYTQGLKKVEEIISYSIIKKIPILTIYALSHENIKRKYFESNAITTELKTTGSTSDYSNDESIHGGQPRIAYLPMNGKKPWGYSSS